MRERFASRQSTCLVCFGDLTRGLTLEDVFKRNDCLCGACRKQLIELWTTVTVLDMRVTSIYLYTPFFENLIFQFKDAKDLPLAPLFLTPYTFALRWRLKHHVVVTVPSSPKRTAARGFVPVVSLFNAIGVNVLQPFEKDEVKQSQRSSKTRSHIKRHIRLIDKDAITGKHVILVDDVCTTGQSLKACYALLKPHVKTLSCLVIAIHPELIQSIGGKR